MSEPKDQSGPFPAGNDDEGGSAEIAREAAQIAGLHAEMVELKDRYLRAVAELENVRKRSEREKTEAAQFAFSKFARDLLNVLDNFGRAFDSLDGEVRAALPAGAKSVLDGVEATQREMVAIFERYGIKRVDAKGRRFDPNHHSAIAEVPTREHPAGTVIDVAQQGYTIGGRLLREAMVVVAKAPPEGEDSSFDTTV